MPYRTTGYGRGTGRGTKTETKRKQSPERGRARHRERDRARKGVLEEPQRQEMEPEDLNLLAPDFELDDLPPGASDVRLSDEDALPGDGDDMSDGTNQGSSLIQGVPLANVTNRTAIVVVDERASFQVPDWAASTVDEDRIARWETYSKIAEWLNRSELKKFLKHPSFTNLVESPIDLAAPVPVLQAGLCRLLGCDEHTFSKHCEGGLLLWSNRAMDVDVLWSRPAKLAWCAQATIQRQRRHYSPASGPLDDPTIQPPRAARDRERIQEKVSVGASLGPIEFVQLLCVLTKCSWRDVLQEHHKAIFCRDV